MTDYLGGIPNANGDYKLNFNEKIVMKEGTEQKGNEHSSSLSCAGIYSFHSSGMSVFSSSVHRWKTGKLICPNLNIY